MDNIKNVSSFLERKTLKHFFTFNARSIQVFIFNYFN